MEQAVAREWPRKRGKIGGALGLVSLTLLLASLRWAHHWGPQTDTLVASWGLATISAFLVSVWSLRTSLVSRRLAFMGFCLALLSVLALPVVAALYAAGVDVAEACGGG